MAEGFIATRLEVNDNLPAAVSYLNLTNQVVGGKAQVEVTWGNPTEHFAGVAIVRKEGGAPASYMDGLLVYDGTGTSYIDENVVMKTNYFYRAYTYNARRQLQTLSVLKNIITVDSFPSRELSDFKLIYIPENGMNIMYFKTPNYYDVFTRCASTSTISLSDTDNGISLSNKTKEIFENIFPPALDVFYSRFTGDDFNRLPNGLGNASKQCYHDGLNGSDSSGGLVRAYFVYDSPKMKYNTDNTLASFTGTVAKAIRPQIAFDCMLYSQPDRDGVYSIVL